MSAPVLKKIHTFADDLTQARSERGMVVKTSAPRQTTSTSEKTVRDEVTVSNTPGTGPKKITTATATQLKPSANDLPATIITDQKGKRFSLTAEMSSAIGEWWNEKVKSVKKTNKKNRYSLPAAERRKGVVTTATTHTGRHAASDYHAVVQRVKAKPETLPAPAPIVAPAVVVSPTEEPSGWGDNDTLESVTITTTPKTYPPVVVSESINEELSPESAVANQVLVTDVTYRQPRIEPTIPLYDEEVTDDTYSDESYDEPTTPNAEVVEDDYAVREEPEPVPPLVPTPRSFEKIAPIVPAIPLNNTIERSGSASAFTMLSEVPAPVLQSKPDYVKASIATRKETLENALPTKRSTRLGQLAPYVAGGTFVIVTVGSIAYFMLSGTTDTNPTVSGDTELPTDTWNPSDEPSVIPTGGVVTAQLDAPNKTSLFNLIASTANQGEGLQIVTPLTHDTALPLGSRELLGLLNRQFTPAFIGSVTGVRVGMYRDVPIIIISVTDNTTAKGSMFTWENTMSQDLSPWFGIPLSPKDNGAGSDFGDGTVGSIDVRVLKDDLETERIVYGIIDQSTIIITTNTTAFLNINDNYSF